MQKSFPFFLGLLKQSLMGNGEEGVSILQEMVGWRQMHNTWLPNTSANWRAIQHSYRQRR
jgi:hypothetical protein